MPRHQSGYYLNKAEDAGCKVKGGAKHFQVYAPPDKPLPSNLRNPLSIPRDIQTPGTEHQIIKWLTAIGAIILVIVALIIL